MTKPKSFIEKELENFGCTTCSVLFPKIIKKAMEELRKEIEMTSKIRCEICKCCHTHHVPIVLKIIEKVFGK